MGRTGLRRGRGEEKPAGGGDTLLPTLHWDGASAPLVPLLLPGELLGSPHLNLSGEAPSLAQLLTPERTRTSQQQLSKLRFGGHVADPAPDLANPRGQCGLGEDGSSLRLCRDLEMGGWGGWLWLTPGA